MYVHNVNMQASLRSTRRDLEKIASNGEPLELPLLRKPPKVPIQPLSIALALI